jgi:site-specific DNA recombinase
MKGHSLLPENTRKAGIWIRVSTEDSARGDSPKHHEQRARDYAKFNGWKVVELYDPAGLKGWSGKTVAEHPEFKRMMADVKRGHITTLIFSKLARVARNTRELLDLAEFFRANNADMVSLQEKIDTSSPAGRLFYTMIAALAQWEREEIAERVKGSIVVRAKMGKSLGGAAPFGYRWQENKLVPDPAEAPIRRRLYELFAEHKRHKSVARKLNEEGYRTRNGSRFTDTTVVRLVQDMTAKGLYRANHTYRDDGGKLLMKPESEWVFTKVEPIIPEELWDRCNEMLKKRKDRRPLGPKPIHPFAGLLFCGCGQKMYVFSRTPKYVCPGCRNKIPIVDLDAIFKDEVRDFFISREKVREHLSKANEHLAGKRQQLAAHIRQLERVRTEMRKVYQLYQADEINPEGFGKLHRPLQEQEQSLANQLPTLQAEVDALEVHQISAEEVVSEAANLHQLWPELTASQKRTIVESIVEKIVLTGDEIDITLCYLPSSEELTKRQRNLSGSSRPPA